MAPFAIGAELKLTRTSKGSVEDVPKAARYEERNTAVIAHEPMAGVLRVSEDVFKKGRSLMAITDGAGEPHLDHFDASGRIGTSYERRTANAVHQQRTSH